MKNFLLVGATFLTVSAIAYADAPTSPVKSDADHQSVSCFADYFNNEDDSRAVLDSLDISTAKTEAEIKGFVFKASLDPLRHPKNGQIMAYRFTMTLSKNKSSTLLTFYVKKKSEKATGGHERMTTALSLGEESVFVSCDVKDE